MGDFVAGLDISHEAEAGKETMAREMQELFKLKTN
jgi:hypothetical protein